MTFECDGVRYDTDALLTFGTGDAHQPFIYMTRDGASVFVGALDKWTGFNVHRADAAEIRSLAARFGIDELMRAADVALPGLASPPPDAHPAIAKTPDADGAP